MSCIGHEPLDPTAPFKPRSKCHNYTKSKVSQQDTNITLTTEAQNTQNTQNAIIEDK